MSTVDALIQRILNGLGVMDLEGNIKIITLPFYQRKAIYNSIYVLLVFIVRVEHGIFQSFPKHMDWK